MSGIEPTEDGLCVVCEKPLQFRENGSMRIIEFEEEYLDIMIRDLAKIDPEIAAEVNIHNGILPLHEDCKHPVEQYLPDKERNEII